MYMLISVHFSVKITFTQVFLYILNYFIFKLFQVFVKVFLSLIL